MADVALTIDPVAAFADRFHGARFHPSEKGVISDSGVSTSDIHESF